MTNMGDATVRPESGAPSAELLERLGRETELAVAACYQCKKCSSGCPLTFAMDLLPDQVIRLALLGQEERLLSCRTIWVCSSCQTCTTRCPNRIDIAGVMDWLKEEALKQGKEVPAPEVAAFHRFFLEAVRAHGGRVSEAYLVRRFTLFKLWRRPDLGELLANFKLGLKLMKRGRLRLAGPRALKGRAEIDKIFEHYGT
jgi:heterodisulfide reductase subunit C